MAIATHKTSVSIHQDNWNWLAKSKNRSSIINSALELYHSRQQYLAQAERERHATHIQSGLDDISDGNTITYSGSSAEEMKSFIHSLAA